MLTLSPCCQPVSHVGTGAAVAGVADVELQQPLVRPAADRVVARRQVGEGQLGVLAGQEPEGPLGPRIEAHQGDVPGRAPDLRHLAGQALSRRSEALCLEGHGGLGSDAGVGADKS